MKKEKIKTAQTTLEFIMLAGLTVIAVMVILAIFSTSLQAVFTQSNFSNTINRGEVNFENPNSSTTVDRVEKGNVEGE